MCEVEQVPACRAGVARRAGACTKVPGRGIPGPRWERARHVWGQNEGWCPRAQGREGLATLWLARERCALVSVAKRYDTQMDSGSKRGQLGGSETR